MRSVIMVSGEKSVTLNTREEMDEFNREKRKKLFPILEEKRKQRRAQNSVTIDSLLRVEDEDEHLLPGLPNDITFQQIVPKLPWKAFHSLSAVKSCWKRAIRSHEVFDARVRSNSTAPLFVLNHTRDGAHRLCLYSVSDKSWHQLPLFPHSHRVPHGCQWISLDGKLYVLGGGTEQEDYSSNREWYADRESREVYVLDVAGQREWKQCANMLEARRSFGCGVMNGKIYVFGGTRLGKYIHGCEVYDPKENAWSSITPMKFMRSEHHVVIVGEELFVLGGDCYDPGHDLFRSNSIGNDKDPAHDGTNSSERYAGPAQFAEIYHPGKGEWRLVKPLLGHCNNNFFSSQGNLFEMSKFGIYECDVSRFFMHSYCSPGRDNIEFVFASYVVDDELFALVKLSHLRKTTFVHIKDFDGEDEEIPLEKLDCFLPYSSLGSPCADSFMCPMRL